MIRRFLNSLKAAPPPPAAAPPHPMDLGAQTRLVDEHGHPNINDLWRITKDIDALRLSVKALGYELARTLEAQLQSIPVEHAQSIGLQSKACTQADIESRWCRGWCATLRERPRYHRRLWESAFVLQTLFEAGALISNSKVLALGGVDPSVISHLARNDVRSTLFGPAAPNPRDDLTDPLTFQDNVTLVPDSAGGLGQFSGFDACWSLGHAGRAGSIRQGMDFIIAAMDTLRPGGLAVHVFDFNFSDDSRTIDNWPAVLFQQRHIQTLAEELTAKGYAPRPLDFHLGHQPLDRFVDIPPFDMERSQSFAGLWRDGWQSAHLKVAIDGFPVTSFGMIVQKGG